MPRMETSRTVQSSAFMSRSVSAGAAERRRRRREPGRSSKRQARGGDREGRLIRLQQDLSWLVLNRKRNHILNRCRHHEEIRIKITIMITSARLAGLHFPSETRFAK